MTRIRTGSPANEKKGSRSVGVTKARVGGRCEFSEEVSVLWVSLGSILLKSHWTRMESFEDWRVTLGEESRVRNRM